MTILELKELIRPLSEEDKHELKRILGETTDVDIMYRLDELTRDLPVPEDVPTDFAKNFRQYAHKRKIAHE